MIRFLTVSEVVALHDVLLARYGGESGILGGTDVLESAVVAPRAGSLHEDDIAIAAAYLYHIVMDHPFLDANKRTGCAAAMTFLRLNGYTPTIGVDELRDLAITLKTRRLSKAKLTAAFRRLT